MPDISMCKGSIGAFICPKKETCYRYKAEPTPNWQSYFLNPPYDRETGDCQYYWNDGSDIKPLSDEKDND
jgi:hypothetical protein